MSPRPPRETFLLFLFRLFPFAPVATRAAGLPAKHRAKALSGHMKTLSAGEFTPRQAACVDTVRRCLAFHPLIHLSARDGTGRTSILEALHKELGGSMVTIRDYVKVTAGKPPLGTDEWLCDLLIRRLKKHETVFVDDFHLAQAVSQNCNNPRSDYLSAAMEAVSDYAERSGRRLIVATQGRLNEELAKRMVGCGIGLFAEEDFAAIGRNCLGDSSQQVDWTKVHRFAPYLTARELRKSCAWLVAHETPLDTDSLLEYLASHHLASNVEIDEVDDIELSDLFGVDEVVAALEENIVLPLTDDELAEELDLQPKRGVLLAGPPGTGKTTVGRALAHRLGGKFFLVDGTAISGTDHFYHQIDFTFRRAVHNSPSVVFIDDSDVIFESGKEHGLYRYLLTKLDGLESASAGRVCVMLTAMDVGNIPPALVRSGRIELWLEMRLPDPAARQKILEQHIDGQPLFEGVDLAPVVERSDEFSGADLKRLVQDAKLAYAGDRKANRPTVPIGERLVAAANQIRRNREVYAEAEARANARRPTRPQWFSPMSDFHRAGVSQNGNGDAD
ncbi:ATP-dependent zinc metalloprotease FtsH 1 [Planctomyces sp. SH-PL14]|nr:ATP-dependent zinc metalloprotease FtsH 1 [Planctomyces sp. SH-PL14]